MIDLHRFGHAFPDYNILNCSECNLVVQTKKIESNGSLNLVITWVLDHIGEPKCSIDITGSKISFFKKIKSKYQRMYTSGCFDIFHYGHLNILIKSKELCDHLIVGVSTDELIKKEKGRKPIIPFEERMKVVKAIGLVDEVIPQVDKEKQKIVDTYKIDAISVGDDWRGRYPKVSCSMEYFPYTDNVSSTILKNALKLIEQDNS